MGWGMHAQLAWKSRGRTYSALKSILFVWVGTRWGVGNPSLGPGSSALLQCERLGFVSPGVR